MMPAMRALLVVAVLSACGNRKEPVGKGSAVTAGSGLAVIAVDAAAPDAAPLWKGTFYRGPLPTAPAPATAVEPPTVESLHVELSYALLAWMRDPTAKELYAKDFSGRHDPDERAELVGYEAFIKGIPAALDFVNPSFMTWLDEGGEKIAKNESRIRISYDHAGGDESRDLMFRREGGKQRLVRETVNGRSAHSEAPTRMSSWLATDARQLGTKLAARIRIEGPFVWVVLENDKKAQAVLELWSDGACERIAPPAEHKDAVAFVRCKGFDFAFVNAENGFEIKRSPAIPMWTNRSFSFAPNTAVVLAP
jgi:hypothetical protein